MKTVLKQILTNRAVIWILIGCLIFLGALQLFVIKGCHSSITKTAPVLQQAEQENNTSSVKKVAEHNPSEKTPPNDPWTTIYSALIPKGASPPDEYHGDILYWIPGMEYETIVNVDGTRESKIVLPDHKEKNDRVHKALGKLKVEYEAQGKSASDEEARQISIEIWTDGFSALNAAKFLGAGGGALDGKYAIEFAQKALDENPNDFHTLYLWSILHDFNGGPFYNRELEDKAESGYCRLLEMNPNSVPVLHSLGYHLYIERDIKEDPKQSIAESIVLLQKSVQLDPTYLKGSSLYRLAKSYYAVRDTAKAIETLKRLNSLFPSERIQKTISSLEQENRWPPLAG